MKSWLKLSCMVVFCAITTPQLFAFADRMEWKNSQLTKNAESQVSLLWAFKLFEAALYLENGFASNDYPGEFSYALALRYHKSISRESLINNADDILRDLYPREKLANIQSELEQINQVYKEVNKGDEYTLIYSPDQGTTLLFNGEPQITLKGRDFAEIYFSIWLGDHPKSARLKRDLLNG